MHDQRLEDQLRGALRIEGDALPFTITEAELERRLTLRRRDRFGQRLSLMAAGVAVLAVAGIVGIGNGWVRLPAVGVEASPSPSRTAAPDPGIEPIPGTPGRTEVLRLDPVILKGVPIPIDARAAAARVVATTRCTGAGSVTLRIGEESISKRCEGPTEMVSWFTVLDGHVAGAIESTGTPTVALLLEVPALGEGPSPDPLATLPELDPTEGALDDWSTESAGQPNEADPTRVPFALDGVRLDARDVVLKVACLGPGARFEFGTSQDPTAIAAEEIVCDGTAREYRWHVTDRQPMLDQHMVLRATRATAYRLRVQTLGMLSPTASALPSPAAVGYPVVIDHVHEPEAEATIGGITIGVVPPRGAYAVSVVCLGTGDIRWEIGLHRLAGGGVQPCDGVGRVVESMEGVPPAPMAFIVYTDADNAWRIVVGAPDDEPAFIAPSLFAWPGPEIVEGVAARALARCVAYQGAADSCGLPYHPRDGAEVVELGSDEVIGLALSDGWRIDSVVVDAIRRDTARSDPFGPSLDRVAVVEEGGREVTATLDRLDPGPWVARFMVRGSLEGASFSGVYEIPVLVGS